MKKRIIKIGFSATLFFSLAGALNAGRAKAENSESFVEPISWQSGKVCKVTRRGGASIYVSSLDKYFRIRRGGTMIVVDPEPHQGIIVVRAMLNRKMTRGEIKIDDTNCVPVLPR